MLIFYVSIHWMNSPFQSSEYDRLISDWSLDSISPIGPTPRSARSENNAQSAFDEVVEEEIEEELLASIASSVSLISFHLSFSVVCMPNVCATWGGISGDIVCCCLSSGLQQPCSAVVREGSLYSSSACSEETIGCCTFRLEDMLWMMYTCSSAENCWLHLTFAFILKLCLKIIQWVMFQVDLLISHNCRVAPSTEMIFTQAITWCVVCTHTHTRCVYSQCGLYAEWWSYDWQNHLSSSGRGKWRRWLLWGHHPLVFTVREERIVSCISDPFINGSAKSVFVFGSSLFL